MGKRTLDAHAVVKSLKESTSLPPAVLILGKDTVRKERALRYLCPPQQQLTRLDAATLTKGALEELIGQLKTVSLFGPQSDLYLISPVDGLKSELSNSLKKAFDATAHFSATLFLLGTSLPASHPIRSIPSISEATIEFSPPSPEEICTWVTKELSRQGIETIEHGTALFIASAAHNDIDVATSMCELLALSCDTPHVTVENAKQLFVETPDPNDFRLAELLCGKNKGETYRYLSEIFTSGKNPFGLLSLAQRSLWSLYRIKCLLESGIPATQIAQVMGMPGWLATKQTGIARGVARSHLENLLVNSAQVDSLLKNRSLSFEDTFSMLVEDSRPS